MQELEYCSTIRCARRVERPAVQWRNLVCECLLQADGRRHADHRRRIRLLRSAARLAAELTMEGKVDTSTMRRLLDHADPYGFWHYDLMSDLG